MGRLRKWGGKYGSSKFFQKKKREKNENTVEKVNGKQEKKRQKGL